MTRRHHFAPWQTTETFSFSHCTACGISVQIGRKGGVKFMIGDAKTGYRWVARHPCQPKKP